MSFTDQVVLNNFANSVGEAIQDVGGDISSVQHLCDYPRIIREQLLASGVDVQMEEGEGITITKNGTSYIISANSNATIVDGLGIYDHTIPAGTSIQNTFKAIFENILPTLPSVLSGDLITSTPDGTNQYQHPNGDSDIIRVKKNLTPDTLYLRLFINSQEEPVYISCEPLKQQSGGGTAGDYSGSDGENIKIDVDNVKRTISATLKSISSDLILSDDKLSEEDAGNLFDEIFK